MSDITANVFQQIAERTGGDVYIGVVGPVRTGKSTFVKRVMEKLVIPNIDNIYQRERAIDELPQSGSGKTIMTSEPKFVPEDAVEISPDGTTRMRIRLIDSVGYVIPGAIGAEEDGRPRMVTTPWFNEEIPMIEAAELGTKKIMDDHCSIGIVMTTDSTIHNISRSDFVESENRAIVDMRATGKPFIVLINSTDPGGEAAQEIKRNLEEVHHVSCMCVNALNMEECEIFQILKELLYAFPVREFQFYLPGWINALPIDHGIRKELYQKMIELAKVTSSMHNITDITEGIETLETVESVDLISSQPGTGTVCCKICVPEKLFYTMLSDHTGFCIDNDAQLMQLLLELSSVKQEYDKIASALEQVKATGYGIVMPSADEMKLESPEIVRNGSNFGVRLKASAPSIHMMRADIETEINPIVGDEKQSQELLQYLLQEYNDDTEKLWESNIFGKSVYELVNEGLGSKLKRIPAEARFKLQSTLSRVINEESSGLLCLIFS